MKPQNKYVIESVSKNLNLTVSTIRRKNYAAPHKTLRNDYFRRIRCAKKRRLRNRAFDAFLCRSMRCCPLIRLLGIVYESGRRPFSFRFLSRVCGIYATVSLRAFARCIGALCSRIADESDVTCLCFLGSKMSSVADWYKDKHVLITGATGFMGKIMVEKLLRSCPEIAAIYLLIRMKKGKDPTQRIDDFVNNPIFDKIRDQSNAEKVFGKLACIAGDVSMPNLNLSNDDEKTIKDNVDVIFHMAANVRFDQQLKAALLMNTGGTKRLLDLACACTNLKAFVHVSTTYCHCDETILEERVYDAPHDPRKLLDLVTWLDESLLVTLTPKLIKNSPNTYAYTKCLTEQLVTDYSKILPIAIARPSVVTAAWKEPIPGWVDNLNGPTGLLVGAGKGVIRTMHCNPQYEADIIPVDSTINSIILIAREVAVNPKTHIKVYNLTCDKENRISWGDALELGRKHFYDNPFSVCLWYPGGSIKSNYLLHQISALFLHVIPAYVVDFLLVLTNNKPFLIRTQKRISKGLEVLQYYTTKPWEFKNEKMVALSRSLSRSDREKFYTDTPTDYNEYILNYILGARKYCVHEEPNTIPYAKKVLKRLYYLDLAKNVALVLLFIWFFHEYLNLIWRSF